MHKWESGRGKHQEFLLWRACGTCCAAWKGAWSLWVGKRCLGKVAPLGNSGQWKAVWLMFTLPGSSHCSRRQKKPKTNEIKNKQTNPPKNKTKPKPNKKPQQFAGDFWQIYSFWLLRKHVNFYRCFPWWIIDRLCLIIDNFFILYQFCPLNCS